MVHELFAQWSTRLILLDRQPIRTRGDGGVGPYLIGLILMDVFNISSISS